MKLGEMEITALAAESMGVRSLCTLVQTPDVSILLDPSAALARRFKLEPHPFEYRQLLDVLEQIFVAARRCDILSISHYHFDHVRPGFTNFLYNFSSKEELQRLFEGKQVFAKDNRENINPSQRRRGHFFEKDLKGVAQEIIWTDNQEFKFGYTRIKYSHPLPHGPENTPLGYVISTIVEHLDSTFLFVPDVQGPVVDATLRYILEVSPDLVIIGGPPTYLRKFDTYSATAMKSLKSITRHIPVVVIDHHLMRSDTWDKWMNPIITVTKSTGNEVMTMAEFAGKKNHCLESNRRALYSKNPPTEEFNDWANSTEDYKMQNKPPF